MSKSLPNNQVRGLAIAMAGATVAAVATMFVPTGILEGVTGSTGLSELVPAARAPLGDTARALVAFGMGAITLAALAYALLRQDSAPALRTAHSVPASDWAADDDTPSFKERLANIRLPSVAWPKMPWRKGEDDITELADLPKLRNGDIHPDAPPRRPLVASQDLPVLELVEVTMPDADGIVAEPDQDAVEPLVKVDEMAAEPVPPVIDVPADAVNVQPTLAEMVAQLEAAVAERERQLAQLEVVAARLAAEPSALAVTEEETAAIIAHDDITAETARPVRPPLEAVPASPVKDEEMDAALAAALATLQRMNGTGR